MSKSKKWRNGKKHTLSPEEKLQRDKLKHQRLKKQRIQKHNDRIEFMKAAIPIVILGLLFIGSMVVDVIFDTDFFVYYCLSLWLIGIIVLDKSGLRSFIFKYYPDRFPFSVILKYDESPIRQVVEVCKTTSLLSVWAIIFIGHCSFIWTAIWIISILTIFFYVIFDDKTVLMHDSIARTDDLTSSSEAILVTSIMQFILCDLNILINTEIVLFTLFFTKLMISIYIIVSKYHKLSKISVKPVLILTIGSIAFSFVAFVRVNEDFDFKKPIEYYVTVDDKHIYGGKHREYTIEVKNWDDESKIINISISSDDYHEINVGDKVVICKSGGALGMEYYYFKGKEDSKL